MNKERLLQLADHLEKGHLGHKVFDFRTINTNRNERTISERLSTCGTSGCAVGELPIVWPDRFKFDPVGIVDRETYNNNFYAAEKWFEITGKESEFLFVPVGYADIDEDDEDYVDGYLLSPEATKEQVAERIRMFVEKGGIYEN